MVEGEGIRFLAGEEAATERPGEARKLAGVARSTVPLIREQRPHVVVSDPFTQAPMLAAEVAGARTATLMPDPYHVPLPGLPVFSQGLLPPQSAFGRAAWRAAWPLAERARRRTRVLLNELRAELELAPLERLDGAISESLAMVATFPQLEYPRGWPPHVHVTGPMLFDLPDAGPEPPPGDEPLVVVVASTTGLDSASSFVGLALEALESEPVRVIATVSRRGERWRGPVPANSTIVDWLDFRATMPRASVVVCHGGHGTVARALAEGVPVLVCPIGGNTPQTGARVTWSGTGLMLPQRLLGPGPLRWAVRRLIADSRFAARARSVAAWAGSTTDRRAAPTWSSATRAGRRRRPRRRGPRRARGRPRAIPRAGRSAPGRCDRGRRRRRSRPGSRSSRA